MSDSIRYLRLTDYDNRGKIVRQVGFAFYVFESNVWKRTASIPYFYPDAAEFECYENITDVEARNIIGDGIDSFLLETSTNGQLSEYFEDEDRYFEMCMNLTRPKDIDKIKDI